MQADQVYVIFAWKDGIVEWIYCRPTRCDEDDTALAATLMGGPLIPR